MEERIKIQQVSERPYHNRGLFSEHYLLHRLPEHPVWQEDIQRVFSQMLSLYRQKKKFLPIYNERQTEEEFIQPLFSILGFAYTPQVRFKRHEQVSVPDFALFTSEASKHDAEVTRQSRDDFYETPFFKRVAALSEAKYWGRTLDSRASDKRDNSKSRNRNPHFQITGYLTDSNVRWGILTNGTHWRLYFSGAESQEILYYEVELQRILEEENESDFRYFYHFFSAAAFESDAEERTFLDEVFKQSRSYAKQVEERLKERIFEQVAPALARGFFAYRRDMLNISQETDASPARRDSDLFAPIRQADERNLREVFNGTLLFLYRLIFLLYAEARGLLPVTERQGYFAYSLTKLKGTIFDEQKTGRRFSDVSTSWYNALKSLFAIINRGDANLNVPRYNGGLFAPDGLGDRFLQQATEFLENHAIADSYLAEAIMLLTRELDGTEEPTDVRFIDYRDLDVRHLGSIYEGLLEFKLKIAQQPLVKAREKGKDIYKPLSDVGQILPDVQAGDIYLTNDKSERKATGSYYTPDYIVRYIVENTVGTLIDDILKECRLAQEIRNDNRPWDELFEELLSRQDFADAQHEKSEEEQKAQREAWKLTRNDDERRRFLLNMLDGVQPKHDYDAPTRILELKILDPAIGSGHFLVGAMDFLTRKLVALLEQFPDSPVLKEIEKTRQKIVTEAERQNVRIDAKMLTDENLLRRMVMKRCLYGVDLNPMAVELAKLSLWLHGFTVGAPLSFLDHHLRCGNSLIGATVEEVREHLQKSLFGQQFAGLLNATDMMQQLAELTDATFANVQESQSLYDKAQNALAPFKGLLDVWVSKHFGNDDAQSTLETFPDAVHSALKHLLNGDVEAPQNSKALQVAQKALELRNEKHFFHWELEFPEVWYEKGDERGNPGFDAVIGNPPWGGYLDRHERDYLMTTFTHTHVRTIDSFALLIERGLTLNKCSGTFGFIVPNTLLTQFEWWKLRRFLLNTNILRQVVNLGEGVFEEGVAPCCIIVAYSNSEVNYRISCLDFSGEKGSKESRFLSLSSDSSQARRIRKSTINAIPNYNIVIDTPVKLELLHKLRSTGKPLERFTKEIARGITSSCDSAFVVKKDIIAVEKLEPEVCKPLLIGSSVMRFYIDHYSEHFIIYTDKNTKIERYPNVLARLTRFKDKLSSKREAKQGKIPWYSLHWPRETKLFETGKIVGRQTGDRIIVAFDEIGYYTLDSLFNVVLVGYLKYSPQYFTSLLNSKLLNFCYTTIVQESGRTFAQVKAVNLYELSIRRIFFTTSKNEREQEVAELKSLYEDDDYHNILTRIDELLPKDADGNFLVFAHSISVKDAIAKGYITEQDAEKSALKCAKPSRESGEDAPSGYDESGNPLEKSDVVHDFLAFLAERMTEMNKAKRTQIGRFWTDLEGIADTDTFAKLQKGKQEKSLARKKPLRQFVNPESASSKRLEDALEWTEEAFKEFVKTLVGRILSLSDFLDVYHKYASAVQTLAQRIQATDELIDGIVYRLYGLTEEEIKLVEESVKR